MAPLLTDGGADDAPYPADVELLVVDDPARPGPAPPATRGRLPLRLGALLVATLALGVAVGGRGESWVRDRAAQEQAAGDARVDIADVTLRLSSFQISAVEVALRNEGARALVLEQLTGLAGAVRPRPGVLPVTLPAGKVVSVRLRFGDRCGRGADAGRLDAVVRTQSGRLRALALDVVGDDTEVQYVADTVRAACR